VNSKNSCMEEIGLGWVTLLMATHFNSHVLNIVAYTRNKYKGNRFSRRFASKI
jgi:hypothetical protein